MLKSERYFYLVGDYEWKFQMRSKSKGNVKDLRALSTDRHSKALNIIGICTNIMVNWGQAFQW